MGLRELPAGKAWQWGAGGVGQEQEASVYTVKKQRVMDASVQLTRPFLCRTQGTVLPTFNMGLPTSTYSTKSSQ